MLLTFLTGAAAGAVAAVLTAPRSGKETRAELRRVAEDSRARAKRLPAALTEAGEAAATAFTEALEERNGRKESKHA